VADAVGSAEVLELLHALTQADAAATGPAAWSPWKAGLVDELVGRTAALLAGAAPPGPAPLADYQERLAARGGPLLEAHDDEVTVVAPDTRGLLSLATGVLALHRLDVRSASVLSRGSTAVIVCRVEPRFGSLPDWAVVQNDLRRALAGELDVAAVLDSRAAAYRTEPGEPSVRLLDDVSETATVVEVRAADSVGVLHRITRALTSAGLDVRTAHISTLGADVVDAFYVVGRDGRKVADAEPVRRAVLAALARP
jgi:[protein-PII] uridylyltransferase